MKDSGIEWIGEIPESWEIGQIGHLYDERKEKVSDRDYPPLSVTMKGIVPQLSTAAKTDAHDDRKLVKKGDFAINSRSDRRGSCGISAYDGSVSLINTILCPRNEMNPQYYDWLFHTTMFADEFYKWGHGIVDDLWTTNWSDMKKIGVPIPDLHEQSLIAAYLDRQCALIDSVTEKTKASIEEYKKLRQAVITQAVTKGVRGDRPMKDSGIEWIGEIPEGWIIRKVRNIAQLFNGDRSKNYPSAEELQDDGVLFVTSNNLNGSELDINIETNKYISEDKYDSMGGAKIRMNDIIFCLRGSVGKCSINHCIDKGTVASSLVVIRAIEAIPEYLNYYLKSSFILEQATLNAIGIGSLNLAAEDIAATLVSVPPLEEQQEIAAYLDKKCAEIDALITKKETFLAELEAYKKSLIYEYVTGKKEVPQA